MEKKPTDLLAGYVHKLRFEDLPGEVVESAKLFLMDYLASAMAGYKINKIFNEAVYSVVSGMGGKKESRVFFQGGKLPAPHAALLNAVYGHGADMDDGNRTAQGHPGVGVIPAVLALAEAHRLSGRDVIVAIVAGYDLFVRLATAINPSHLSRGFHTTGTVGNIAAAGAAAKALKLPLAKVRNALSLAALQAAGLLEVAESGQMAKPFHPGKAAFNAILAARLAQAGAEGPREPLEGRKGFFKAFADEVNLEILRKDLGKQFRISSCYIKLYPACRHTHGAIDAALELRRRAGGAPKRVEKVKVHVYPAAINLTGSIREPKNEDEAKFSLVYTVATALTKGHFNLKDLDVTESFDREIREMAAKIEIVSDPRLENRAADIRGARVELVMKDKTTQQVEVKLPKGDPEVPATQEDMEGKLRFCAEDVFPQARQQAILKTVGELEHLKGLSRLTKLLVLE
ncbi:MAG: MmgE/PrpD family protein [Proteobacteria bacterium]|nr:MmgE/PrpD family protein [Pseudomonadota bacterium]MBU2228160.1 MmgE/PrpD family protein [Pseudomonadota bacterium]MBU2262481.1 MmgE/PrpD family protein [Pseudomonadota bacterium]